jgi:hypothetical protein
MQTRRSLLVLVFLAGVLVGSWFAGTSAPVPVAAVAPETVEAPVDDDVDPWAGFDPIASAAPIASVCDETAQMMAAMFGALANAALANAGKDSDGLNASVDTDREAFIQYLAALGIAPDDPRIAAMLHAAFPTTAELAEIPPAC